MYSCMILDILEINSPNENLWKILTIFAKINKNSLTLWGKIKNVPIFGKYYEFWRIF